MSEEESVFDAAEVSEEMPTEAPKLNEEQSSSEEEWSPTVAVESPAAKKARLGEKKEMDGEKVTVKEVFHTRPKTKSPDGATIPPKETLSKPTKQYYPGKLGIRFEEENLVEYYPNFHYFVNDSGAVSTFAKINRGGKNEVSKIFRLVVSKLGKPEDEVSDQEVYDYLIGKKVKIKTASGTYMNNKWFRNDIVDVEPFTKEE